MRKFRFEKLVRDKIPEDMEKEGCRLEKSVFQGEKLIAELIKKISEEAKELARAKSEKIPEEAADLQELIDELCRISGISPENLKRRQTGKIEKFGGFGKGQFVHWVEVPDDSPWIKHYEKDPEQYPEIK